MLGNIGKTLYYLNRNGLGKTVCAIRERLSQKEPYKKEIISEAELERQRKWVFEAPLLFDIIVPAYHTDPEHYKSMITSVIKQTYPYFRLLIGDAGAGDDKEGQPRVNASKTKPEHGAPSLKALAEEFDDDRILYFPLKENLGISGNSNQILQKTNGDFVFLLDHDDVIEPDALFRFAKALDDFKNNGLPLPKLLYSDEDKCDNTGTVFFDPHYKKDFDEELLMSNNYICHLTCIERETLLKHRFRAEYDGAQDHDLFLRISKDLGPEGVYHIKRILYHWRAHPGSTSDNPGAKLYAYEAGRRCVEDYCKQMGWDVKVSHTQHLGFFRVDYNKDIFIERKDVGAVCGPIYERGRVASGMLDKDGMAVFKNLPKGFSGYMKRAALCQEAEVGDVKNMRIRPSLMNDPEIKRLLKENADNTDKSLKISAVIKSKKYKILYDPQKI